MHIKIDGDKRLVSMNGEELADTLLTRYKASQGIVNFRLLVDPSNIKVETKDGKISDVRFVVTSE